LVNFTLAALVSNATYAGYYASIVELCIKVIEVLRRTFIVQTISSVFNPFEAEFKPFLDRLAQATKDIELHILYASHLA
jgi:Skp family chaperone for outer membrane proteins